MKTAWTVALCLSLCAAVAPSALAQVSIYAIGKAGSSTQVADDTPPSLIAPIWGFYTDLQTVAETDAASAVMTFEGSERSPFVLEPVPGYGIFRTFGGYFPSREALDADFPAGLYTFTVDGGTLGVQVGTLDVPEDLYPATVPYVAGDTFSRLSGMDPAAAFTGSFPPFDIPAEATDAFITIVVTIGGGAPPAYAEDFPADATSFTIPAGVLSTDTLYNFAIDYTAAITGPGDFPDNESIRQVAFTRDTQFTFHTAGGPACTADFNGDGFVNSQDFFDFVSAFFAEEPHADFNHDSTINSQDFFDFLAAFFAGC